MHDIIIIGGGPAGLTAALYARRAGKRVLIIEKGGFGGQMTFSPKIENYPAFLSVSGSELADKMVGQVLEQGADVEVEEVTGIERRGGDFHVRCGEKVFAARAVILATGARHRLLGVPGEEKFLGDGVSFCAVCDGAFYKDRHVIVVGGGNSALQEALLLAETAEKVTVVQNLDEFTGEVRLCELLAAKPNVETIFGHTVVGIVGEEALTGAEVEDVHTGARRVIPADGVFVAIGLAPDNGTFESLVALDRGYIAAGEDCKTSAEGIFTAGDCRTKGVRQIATAVADGATAALAACRYIDGE